MHFFVYESYMVFDHKKEKIHVIEDALYSDRSQEDLEKALNQVLEELRIPAPMNLKIWIYHRWTSSPTSILRNLSKWWKQLVT